jgi:hypothetical protein
MRLSLLATLLPVVAVASQKDYGERSQVVMSTVVESDSSETLLGDAHTHPALYDLLTIQSSVSIFFSYARETDLSARFDGVDGPAITLFAPTNHAVMALPRKP